MVNSLLTAIVRADGDALVMHVGERPYVVASHGPVELSSRPLTMEAVAGMLGQLLPSNSRRALDELGAIEFELPKATGELSDRFTVVAARGGDDIWIEVRRHRKPAGQKARLEPPAAPAARGPRAAVGAPAGPIAAPPPGHPSPVAATPSPASRPAPTIAAPSAVAPPAPAVVRPPASVPPTAPVTREQPSGGSRVAVSRADAPAPVAAPPRHVPAPAVGPVSRQSASPAPPLLAPLELRGAPGSPAPVSASARAGMSSASEAAEETRLSEVFAPVDDIAGAREAAPGEPSRAARMAIEEALEAFESTRGGEAEPEPLVRPLHAAPVSEYRAAERAAAAPAGAPTSVARPTAAPPPANAPHSSAPRGIVSAEPAVVLPLARNPIRMEQPSRSAPSPRIAGIDRLLRLSAARGGNTLYLMAQARPSVRVDGEIAVLEGEPVLSAPEVESLLLDLAPERSREALAAGEGTEWMSEVPEVGRIRCQSFRDHRGPGGIFRMISARPTSAEQLGLAREIQALCAEPEGLVLVAGPRASGKSTLVSALVDVINRTRNDYVITVESQIKFAHESRGCLVSQREVRGGNDDLAMVVRAALRENPDVLVIEDMRSPEVVRLAIEAMEAGHLVIGAVSAHGSAAGIGRILDQFPDERRAQAQLAVAEGLRGVISQVLLRKTAGGRVAAREILLNMPSIANLIAEGRISQLPLAIDSGRKHGMVPLNDALAAFVQSGVVDAKEAYRKAFERQAFLAVLRREGVDTSFVERLA